MASAAPSEIEIGRAARVISREDAAEPGALVIGADYRGLTVARSLGRRGIPVWVLIGEQSIAAKSRYAIRHFAWPNGERQQLDLLVQLASEHGLRRWLLVPTDDGHAALIARHRAELEQYFTLATCSWKALKWAYDKRRTYRLARALKIACPLTACPRTREEIASLEFPFPAILKPAFKQNDNSFTHAKAWLVKDREHLLARYDEACELVGSRAVMIQEMIPGCGEYQYAFGALCVDGKPLASVTARRLRQYPTVFGRSSSLVETIQDRKVERDACCFLQALRFTGLVEVEFKLDPRDGQYKILDVNPRVWGWHTIGLQAGIDFPYLFWRLAFNKPIEESHARSGFRWMRMVTDIPAVTVGIWRGAVSPASYVREFRLPAERAVFALDDLLPVALEIPMLMSMWLKHLWCSRRSSRVLPSPTIGHPSGTLSQG